ncbi:RNA-directed DNA polymerase [Brucella sp. 458]|uniref:antiviral reverse transcriptase Drt3b n=1 Tax=Brucella sp. 458 TaxID=2821140 RepID=UPI001AE06FA5|nr:antiviral reverse transcriptase Drt3b [Brucella sp. 458]QTO00445.1 RNA-directed DNA polymerase [Brucella sp. 458]
MNKRWYIKGSLRKSDFLRGLLTDTAPYELPVIISNDGFYRNLAEIDTASITLQELIRAFVVNGEQHYTVPYRFNISKDQESRRQLSLIHPKAQYKIAEFYNKYDTLICYYCSLSSASIRRPAKVGSTFFFRSAKDRANQYKGSKVDTTDVEMFIRNPASFFSYAGVDRLHKFFSSSDFMRLEKKYPMMRLADISKCFSSIYTHSVSWAVKSPQHSKDNHSAASFGNDFDKLMQKMNFNETNGICIGPEVSRVFAEVILSAVDVEIVRRAQQRGLKNGREFEYRRYVDDFIIFSNEESTASTVTGIIEDCLAAYNLHLNEAKTTDFSRPFLTPKSHIVDVAKRRLNIFFEGVIDTSRPGLLVPKKIYRPDAVVKSLIASIKSGCFEEHVGYDLVANYVISSLIKRIEALISGFDEAISHHGIDPVLYPSLMIRLMEAVFFFYTVSPTVPSSYNVSRAVILLWRFLSEKMPEEMLSASGQLQRWVGQLIRQHTFSGHLSRHKKVPVEFLNIILAASDVQGANHLDEMVLRKSIFSADREDYFSLVCMLYYIKNDANYASLRMETEQCILRLLDGCSKVTKCSHDAHLTLDAICCPYLSSDARKKILADFRAAVGQPARTDPELEADILEMENKPWFVQWEKVDILRMVTKKELSAVY